MSVLRTIFSSPQPKAKILRIASLSKGEKETVASRQKQNDAEYRASQRLSQQKWRRNNPDYYRNYRAQNPEKTERNRTLQRIRNRRRRRSSEKPPKLIAKMDARKAPANGLSGHYWLVPVIAKMDVTKIYIHAISASCEQLQRWTRGQKCV